MITLLVSSKTMLEKKSDLKLELTQPALQKEAEEVQQELLKLDQTHLRKIMHISENLAKEVEAKIKQWGKSKKAPAWLLFSGDVYKGLKAESLSAEDFAFAQEKVRTLSGKYGILRPQDGINAYRVELGYRLTVGKNKNLYEFWGDKVAKQIPENEEVINLSSEEYIKVLRPYLKKDQIITPRFLQTRADGTKFEAIHAKIARGAMARWIIQNRINDSARLKEFCEDGYEFNVELSSKLEPVFMRVI